MRHFPVIPSVLLALCTQAQSPPGQPSVGYGRANGIYASVDVVDAHEGATGFDLYIPDAPHADSLPVVVFLHGYGAWNPAGYGAWIDHLVKRGNIVVFPRYQVSELSNALNYTSDAATGIGRALDTLAMHPEWTQMRAGQFLIVGHSFGGVITANLAHEHTAYGLPTPSAIMACAPGYGLAPGAALPTYAGMDPQIAILSIFEAEDTNVDSLFALRLYNEATDVPVSRRNLVVHHPDEHGTPAITAVHAEAGGVDLDYDNGETGLIIAGSLLTVANTTDYFCYWKLFDALEDCTLNGAGCTTAFGDTPEQKDMGPWSDGVPVVPLEIRPSAEGTGIRDATPGPSGMQADITGGRFTVSFGSGMHLPGMLTVTDIVGRTLLQRRIASSPVQLTLPTAAVGIYALRFSDGAGHVHALRVAVH